MNLQIAQAKIQLKHRSHSESEPNQNSFRYSSNIMPTLCQNPIKIWNQSENRENLCGANVSPR